MTSKINWSGVFPAATTHFNTKGELDLVSNAKHLNAMLDAGIHGMVMLGTVGENNSLSFAEKLDVLEMAVKTIKKRVPVLTGVAETTTAGAIAFAQKAKQVGVDGIMLLPGMVYKSDPHETITHFRAVAKAVDLPIMIYNNPVSYGIDVLPKQFQLLADLPNIVAIKESSENPRRITDIINILGDRFTLFCGVDDLAFESIALGAQGWISGLINAFPAENRLLWDLMMARRWEEALAVYRWYTPVLHLDTHSKLVQYIKLTQSECGFGNEVVRAPRLPITGVERDEVLAVIRKAIATRPSPIAV
jgi:1-pyrroline-4-hydroxy-2-carboxylate deaminase